MVSSAGEASDQQDVTSPETSASPGRHRKSPVGDNRNLPTNPGSRRHAPITPGSGRRALTTSENNSHAPSTPAGQMHSPGAPASSMSTASGSSSNQLSSLKGRGPMDQLRSSQSLDSSRNSGKDTPGRIALKQPPKPQLAAARPSGRERDSSSSSSSKHGVSPHATSGMPKAGQNIHSISGDVSGRRRSRASPENSSRAPGGIGGKRGDGSSRSRGHESPGRVSSERSPLSNSRCTLQEPISVNQSAHQALPRRSALLFCFFSSTRFYCVCVGPAFFVAASCLTCHSSGT